MKLPAMRVKGGRGATARGGGSTTGIVVEPGVGGCAGWTTLARVLWVRACDCRFTYSPLRGAEAAACAARLMAARRGCIHRRYSRLLTG